VSALQASAIAGDSVDFSELNAGIGNLQAIDRVAMRACAMGVVMVTVVVVVVEG